MRTGEHILRWVNDGKVTARCSCGPWSDTSTNREVVRQHHADHVQEESDREQAARDGVQITIPVGGSVA